MDNSVSQYCFTLVVACQNNRIESQSEVKSEMQRYLFGIKMESASCANCINDTINEDNNTMTEICNRVCWLLYLIINDFVCTMVHCRNDAILLLRYALSNGFSWEFYKFKCWFGDEKFLRLQHSLCDRIYNQYIDMITIWNYCLILTIDIIEYEYDLLLECYLFTDHLCRG